MSEPQVERRRRALGTARAIASRHGLACDGAAILHDSNHTVIHLAPAPVVAKVNTSPQPAPPVNEVDVARFLVQRGAPVVPPASLVPPGPHMEDGLEVTFWQFCPHKNQEPAPEVHGRSLRVLHDALAAYPAALPFWDSFGDVAGILEDDSALGALVDSDRSFLRQRFLDVGSELARDEPPMRVLHGEPHGKNLLLSADGPRWIDFEAVCLGPQEWDLTMLPDRVVADNFADVDWDLLGVLRQMRSLCVAVWCWLEPDRAPVLREAGEYHLSLLKRRAAR
jgi:hypothetical protein